MAVPPPALLLVGFVLASADRVRDPLEQLEEWAAGKVLLPNTAASVPSMRVTHDSCHTGTARSVFRAAASEPDRSVLSVPVPSAV